MAKKKLSHNLFPKKIVILASFLLIACLYYFKPWQKKTNTTKKTHVTYTNYNIPDISPERGRVIEHVFEKGDIKCITTYNITTTLPIYIKRYYPNENRTEYFILKPLDVYTENVDAMYELVKNSKKHIGKFEGVVLDMFSDKEITHSILTEKNIRMSKNPDYLSLGVWYKKEGEPTERLIGSVTIDPSHQEEESIQKGIPEGAYGSYFTGDPAYIDVKGIAYISIRALIDHMIYLGRIKKSVILIIDKRNIGSNNIAKKLHMHRHDAKGLYPSRYWPYRPTKIEDAYLYKISVKEWKKVNWKKK